ncbi:uncharacterized protein [Pseudorasbora parva]|uniref:uncharacterized protein isoform X2 n=1 Tax=Pseudorasbora parva TaxID=51549 RepID=UPI00351F6F28
MACGEIRGKLIVFFTCIILIECRSLLQLSETQETKDGGSEFVPERFMPDHEWFDEADEADFEYPDDDASVAVRETSLISALQEKMRIQGHLVSSSEVALDALSPKLKCGNNLIKLQLNGPEVTQVELSRDNGAPVSLTELPTYCGQTTPTNGGLVYATPYDGCGVIQQGGRYVVHIQWKGNTAVASCPMLSSTTENEPFRGPNPPTYLQILQYRSYPDAPGSAADPMPKPSTSETVLKESTSTSQEMPKTQTLGYPQAFPTGLAPKPTVVQAPTQTPQTPVLPRGFWPNYYPYYHHGRPKPKEKPVPNSMPTATSVAQASTQKPQSPGYFQGFRPNYYPQYHHHGRPKPTEKPVPTIMTTTSITQAPTQEPKYPGYPEGFRPNYYPHYHHYGRPKPIEQQNPNSMPTTASFPLAPPQKPKRTGYPQGFWPHYYPYYYPHGKPNPTKKPDPVIPTTSPSILQATTQKPQPLIYPGKPFPPYNTFPNYYIYLQQLYSQYPLHPPNMPPITPPPSDAACGLSGNQPQNEPPPYHMLYEKDPFALPFVDSDSFP